MIFIDTNVAIDLLDEDAVTLRRFEELGHPLHVPVMVWVELEQGLSHDPTNIAIRRKLLNRMLESFPAILFEPQDIRRYGEIVGTLGYSRPKAADRLIAAQCLTRSASLITRNARDFREIDGLQLIEW